MVHQHPQLQFVVCSQGDALWLTTKSSYQSIHILAFVIIWLSLPIILIMFMHVITIRLELCGIRPWHRLTTHWHLSSLIFHRGANISGVGTSVLTSKQHPHFSHNDFSLSIRITFQHSLLEQIHNSFIHIAISLPLFHYFKLAIGVTIGPS